MATNEIIGPQKTSLKMVLKEPGIPLLYLVYFLTFLGFSLFYAGLPIYANTILEWSSTNLGIFLAYSSLIMIIVQGPVLTKLEGKVSNEKLILIGSFVLALSFLLLSYQSLLIIYLSNTLLSLWN